MNMNMPFEDSNPEEEMTMEEFTKTQLTIEDPIDKLKDFMDSTMTRIKYDLQSNIDSFISTYKLEVNSLRLCNASQEKTIKELENQIDAYKQRLIKLQELSEKTEFNKALKDFEADFKYFARV